MGPGTGPGAETGWPGSSRGGGRCRGRRAPVDGLPGRRPPISRTCWRRIAEQRSVVVAGGNDDDLVLRHEVDEAVLVIYPPRPCPRQVILERLRLADAREGIAAHVLDELVDPGQRLAVGP